jgi:hypothetical protein
VEQAVAEEYEILLEALLVAVEQQELLTALLDQEDLAKTQVLAQQHWLQHMVFLLFLQI